MSTTTQGLIRQAERSDRAAELAEHLAKRLDALRPDEASAARVLRELVKNQRLD